MKKIIIGCCLVLLSFQAGAQSDYAATWTISGLTFGTNADDQLLLDLDESSRFIKVNGVLLTDEGDAWNAAGNCHFTTDEFLICTMSIDFYTLEVIIDLVDGSGTAAVLDYDGFFLEEGSVVLTDLF